MSDDIVSRLRAPFADGATMGHLMKEAAEWIERLKSQLFQCQEALERVYCEDEGWKEGYGWPVGGAAGAYDLMADEILKRGQGQRKRHDACHEAYVNMREEYDMLESASRSLTEAIWQAYKEMGFDTDGCDSYDPARGPADELILWAAREMRRDYDNLLEELE